MLDCHIEHHLFPGLSYAKQRAIKPLVEQAAREFGLPYYEHSSLWVGTAAHLAHMHTISRKPTDT